MPAQKPLWTSFPKRSSGLARLALGFWLAGCHLASVAAVTLQPPHLELRPSWLPARLGWGHLPFSSGPRRGEGANPSSHRMADDLGDPEDYRNLAFVTLRASSAPLPCPLLCGRKRRWTTPLGRRPEGKSRPPRERRRPDGLTATESQCQRNTAWSHGIPQAQTVR